MSFPKYQEYKDSGVQWLGQFPSHWGCAPTGRYFDVAMGQTILKEDLTEEGIPVFSATEGDHYFGYLDRPKVILHPGDIVIPARGNSIGSAKIVKEISTSTQTTIYCKSRSNILVSEFSYYFMNGMRTYLFDFTQTAIPQITTEQVKRNPILLPPVEEQSAIATFLDRETAKIDALVAEQEKLIELLKEKRQAVISHAVTKGLDPNVPMKDSGVEWLGEVPEHWAVGAIKNFYEFLDGKRIPLSGEERSSRSGEYPYYGASGVIDWIDDFIFDEDLVLVSEDGANLFCRSTPIAFVARGKYWVNNHAHILRPPDNALIYWAERIETIDLTPVLSGSAQPKLTSEALANIRIAIPPTYEERLDIQMFISQEAEGIDALVSQAQRAIDLLKERRSALISAAVTGKIDVRGLTDATQ